MLSNIIKGIEKEYLKPTADVEFGPGDTVAVFFKIQEGNKTRIQKYQGVVIKRSGSGLGATFTVRKQSGNGVYVERVFPLHSPLIDDLKVVRRGKVRRAKLYYLRERTGKAVRIKEKK